MGAEHKPRESHPKIRRRQKSESNRTLQSQLSIPLSVEGFLCKYGKVGDTIYSPKTLGNITRIATYYGRRVHVEKHITVRVFDSTPGKMYKIVLVE